MRRVVQYLAILMLAPVFVVMALAAGPKTTDQPLCGTPMMKSVDPSTAKAGAMLTVFGANLEQACVSKVYLSHGGDDFLVTIVEQKPDSIKVRIPADVKPGRFGLVVLMANERTLLDEPVWVTIEP